MKINNKKHQISETNRYKNVSPKTQILITCSLRKSDYHINRFKCKEFGKCKKWNTYTITRDGLIYEHYDSKYHTDFLGIIEADKQIISIVLENMGCLFKGENDEYINWINETCDKKDVVNKKNDGFDYWENIPSNQFYSTIDLCKYLCDKHGIPKDCIEFTSYHKDIIKYRGIVFKSNYINDVSDMNPLFDIELFNIKIKE